MSCYNCNNIGDFRDLGVYNEPIQKQHVFDNRTAFDKQFMAKYDDMAQKAYGPILNLINLLWLNIIQWLNKQIIIY